jgi:hypothetical protein
MQFMVFDTQPNLIHRMVRNYENKGPDGVSNDVCNLQRKKKIGHPP